MNYEDRLLALHEASTPGPAVVEYSPDDHHDATPSPYWYVKYALIEGERWERDSTLATEADATLDAFQRNSAPLVAAALKAAREVDGHIPGAMERLAVALAALDAQEGA